MIANPQLRKNVTVTNFIHMTATEIGVLIATVSTAVQLIINAFFNARSKSRLDIVDSVVKLTSLTLGDVIFIGLATTGDVDTDAIGFYWNGVGNIELRTRNDGVSQNTNTTVSESTSWMKLKFVLTHGGNLEFYIDDVLEGNISASDTSIPTSADPLVLTAIGTVIDASTTEFLVDYMSLEFNVTR